MLTRESILAAQDLKTESVAVPEWGGEVMIRVLSGAQRDRLDAFLARTLDKDGKLKDPTGMRTLVCVLACCDAQGAALFKPEDVDALKAKSSAALDRVFKAAAKLNGLGDAGIEDARENLAGGQSEGSGIE